MTTEITEAPTTQLIGQPIKRVEDPRLITGAAKYLDDLKLPGMAHVAILRSPYAHARISAIRTEAAAASPGVIAVFTGKDFEHLNPLPCAWQAAGTENFVATPRALEIDRVTFTGAGVAAVVAETQAAAEDALALIEVDWEPLPVVVDVEAAVAAGAPQIHEAAASNVVMDWSCGDVEATEQALAEADVVVEQRLVNQRLIPTPMETRGAAAQYEPSTGEYTVWMTSQAPHVMRLLMTAFVFGISETKMRCIAPQVGGGFGSKIYLYPEYVLMAALAEKVGRPVKWIETRRENYVATTHGRDHVTYLRVGATKDGTITALDANTLVVGVPAYVRSAIDAASGRGGLKASTIDLAARDPQAIWSLTADIPPSLTDTIHKLGAPPNEELDQMLSWIKQVSLSQGMDAVDFTFRAAVLTDEAEHASAFSGLLRMGLLALQTELGQEAAKKKGKDADEARQALSVLKTVVNRTDGSTLLVSASVPQTTVAAMVRKQMTKPSTATTGKTTRRTPRRRTTRRH